MELGKYDRDRPQDCKAIIGAPRRRLPSASTPAVPEAGETAHELQHGYDVIDAYNAPVGDDWRERVLVFTHLAHLRLDPERFYNFTKLWYKALSGDIQARENFQSCDLGKYFGDLLSIHDGETWGWDDPESPSNKLRNVWKRLLEPAMRHWITVSYGIQWTHVRFLIDEYKYDTMTSLQALGDSSWAAAMLRDSGVAVPNIVPGAASTVTPSTVTPATVTVEAGTDDMDTAPSTVTGTTGTDDMDTAPSTVTAASGTEDTGTAPDTFGTDYGIDDGDYITHVVTLYDCSCQFPACWHLPCRHQFRLFQQINLVDMPPAGPRTTTSRFC